LANTIAAIHAVARQTYGVRRIHAELRYGHGVRIGRKRVRR
jgi:putative transposase